MVNDSISTIFQSEFHRSIDDTIINRLSETLFCKNLFHEDFWKKLIVSDNGFTKTLISEKGVESLSHVNLAQVFVGLHYRNSNYIDVIEKIIRNFLENKDVSIYYCGLWCVSKLIPTHKFQLNTLFKILELYVCNNNVIFESLFQNILIDIYFQYFQDSMYEEFRRRFICMLFERIDENCLFLIKILERNLCKYNYDLFEIEKYFSKINISNYIMKPELLYCYAMCSRHENNIVETIAKSDEKQANLIARKIFYLSNGKIIKIISQNSIGASIWKLCIDCLLKPDESLTSLFMSIKSMDINLIPNNVFIKLINEGKRDFFKEIKLGKIEIFYVCSFFEGNNFQNMLESKAQSVIRCLFESIYSDREFLTVLTNGSDNETVRKTRNQIIELLKSEIHSRKSFDDIDFYSNLISDCLKCDSIDNENKLKLLTNEIESLLVFQNYLMESYLNSDNLEILSNKPLQLSKEILLLANGNSLLNNGNSLLNNGNSPLTNGNTLLTNGNSPLANGNTLLANGNSLLTNENTLLANGNSLLTNENTLLANGKLLLTNENSLFQLSIGGLKAIIELSRSIINADDFSDNVLCENLFYILLVVCLTVTNDDLTDVAVDFIGVIGKRNTVMNVRDLLEILPHYVAKGDCNRILGCLRENLVLFQFRQCNLSMETIIDSSEGEMKHLLSQLTFVRDYCNACHENIQELIEDLALSCKPSDCYGD